MFTSQLATALLTGGLALVLELIAVLFHALLLRRVAFASAFILTAFGATLLFLASLDIPAILVTLVALYRIINDLRVVSRYVNDDRSIAVTNRTTLVLAVAQVVSLGIFFISDKLGISNSNWLYGMTISALLLSIWLLFATLNNLRRTNIRPSDKYTPDGDLPTVSVCIPARNETDDLPGCLESVLASDYPKLEVLVLDDCSQDRTSEIIRGFAQNGVRFVKGEPPKKGWLAKNQAYQTLAEAASGELLLFCGVDVRFDKKAVRYLVATLIARHKQMLSVMPTGRQDHEHAGIVQPMRYWWELALPRRVFNRPPALSTLWMIERFALEKLNYFSQVSNTVVPEAVIASQIARDDEYTFMRSNGKLKIETVKKINQQYETAVRLRYPQLRKRPESVLMLTLVELLVLILPLIIFITGFFVSLGLLWTVAGLVVITLGYIHYRILKAGSVRHTSLHLLTFPVACLIEVTVTQLSMWRYEFGEVEWKGRNICIPVMKAIPRLPRA